MSAASQDHPVEMSLVMPCYNEEEVLPRAIPPVLDALNATGIKYELILVNNGSRDRTGELIDEMKQKGNVVRVDVHSNVGYGDGILNGLRKARGRISGYMCCDGQVDPKDIVRVYQSIRDRKEPALAKLKRIRRDDGFQRWVITRIFNTLCLVLFGFHTRDINGTPKLMRIEDFEKMKLESRTWFLDFEVMEKAREMKLPLVEVEAPFLVRAGGKSYVKWKTLLEFLYSIFRYRLTGKY